GVRSVLSRGNASRASGDVGASAGIGIGAAGWSAERVGIDVDAGAGMSWIQEAVGSLTTLMRGRVRRRCCVRARGNTTAEATPDGTPNRTGSAAEAPRQQEGVVVACLFGFEGARSFPCPLGG